MISVPSVNCSNASWNTRKSNDNDRRLAWKTRKPCRPSIRRVRREGMLLALQAARVHPLRVPSWLASFLLTVRQRRSLHARLPSAAGKHCSGWGSRGRTSVLRLEYLPRLHLTVHIATVPMLALIDIGSEVSFINAATARIARRLKFKSNNCQTQVLADGQSVKTQGTMLIRVKIGTQSRWHHFYLLPSLRSDMLIGVDLWATTDIILRPPQHRAAAETVVTTTVTPNERLREFLREELVAFDTIEGPTDRT
ncbi:hypothetical protein P5V15_012791 [Pogonomyrmex californicus]